MGSISSSGTPPISSRRSVRRSSRRNPGCRSRCNWPSRIPPAVGQPRNQADKNAGVVRLELQELLQPLLDEGRGAFDSLLIASPDGRVVLRSGDAKLRMASLDRLTRRSAPEQTETTFQDLARAPALTDVVVSGATYKLLTQPCCGRIIRAPVASTAGEGAAAAPASGSATPVKPPTMDGCCAVLCRPPTSPPGATRCRFRPSCCCVNCWYSGSSAGRS